MIHKHVEFGTQVGCVVKDYSLDRKMLICHGDENKMYILAGNEPDSDFREGDRGILTFTEGGPMGGYWKFTLTQDRDLCLWGPQYG